MPLFPQELNASDVALGDAPRRMLFTREKGTRKLLLGLAVVTVAWFGIGKVRDNVLLGQKWAPLQPTVEGLTVVGTLNARGQYERNLLKIVTANQSSRVELTDFGWNSIFDPRNGPLCSDSTGAAIEKARSVDSAAGYAMLEPFLRAAVQKELGDNSAFQRINDAQSLTVAEVTKDGKPTSTSSTLAALIAKFQDDGGAGRQSQEGDSSEGGSGSGRQAEHGVSLPPDTVAVTCPVVLTGRHFSDAWVEEQPNNVFTGKAFTVHLGLTSEGRSRFFQWTHTHANEQMVFVLNHQIVLAGRVPETLDVSQLDITNVPDEKAARQVAEWINNPKNRNG